MRRASTPRRRRPLRPRRLLRQGPPAHRHLRARSGRLDERKLPLLTLAAVLIATASPTRPGNAWRKAWPAAPGTISAPDSVGPGPNTTNRPNSSLTSTASTNSRTPQSVKQLTPVQAQRRRESLTQRRQAQDELDAFGRYLEKTYGPAARAIFDRKTIQAALPPDTALLAWLDIAGAPKVRSQRRTLGRAAALQLRPCSLCLKGQRCPRRLDRCRQLPARSVAHCLAVSPRRRATPAQRLQQQRLLPLKQHLAPRRVKHLIVLPVPGPGRRARRKASPTATTVSYALSGHLLRLSPPAAKAEMQRTAGVWWIPSSTDRPLPTSRNRCRRAACCSPCAAVFQRRPGRAEAQRRAAALRRHRTQANPPTCSRRGS